MSNATLVGFSEGSAMTASDGSRSIISVNLLFRHEDGYMVDVQGAPAAGWVGAAHLGDRFDIAITPVVDGEADYAACWDEAERRQR